MKEWRAKRLFFPNHFIYIIIILVLLYFFFNNNNNKLNQSNDNSENLVLFFCCAFNETFILRTCIFNLYFVFVDFFLVHIFGNVKFVSKLFYDTNTIRRLFPNCNRYIIIIIIFAWIHLVQKMYSNTRTGFESFKNDMKIIIILFTYRCYDCK